MTRSKHCCWTVPIRDWNSSGRSQKISGSFSIMLNCTYERLKHKCANITEFVISNPKKMLNRTYERLKLSHCNIILKILSSWTVPTSEQCAPYTVINVDEKERKPEQLMSVRQIWIVRVFICLSWLCIVY